MAKYAAYRHIELDNVGSGKKRVTKPPGGDCHDVFGNDFGSKSTPSNPHHRITKPPGGDSSDIFGTPVGTSPATPRRVKNHMASTIFSPADEQQDLKKSHRPTDNSFKRLFGCPSNTDLGSPKKHHMKSDIFFVENGHSHKLGNGLHLDMGSNGSSIDGSSESRSSLASSESGSPPPTPNPTGIHGNGDGNLPSPKIGHTNGHMNGNGIDKVSNGFSPSNGNVERPRTGRVPPGGYSSKLW